MVKQLAFVCLAILMLLSGCGTIQSWLPGKNPLPAVTSTLQTPPLPDSVEDTSIPNGGNETENEITVPRELQSTATAIAVGSITNPVSAQALENVTYILQTGTPMNVTGFSHADLGCKWMGIGGQVFNIQSEPVLFLVVEAGGVLNGNPVSALALTGSATAWGPGGFEIKLSDQPVESKGTVWVQFYDLGGTPVSDKVYLTTYRDCDKNAILVNMIQPQPVFRYYFPVVSKDGLLRP